MMNIFKNVSKIIIYIGAGGYILNKVLNNITNDLIYKNSYEQAIQTINKSDMWSSDKLEAIKIIKKNDTESTYAAIISIANGDMWSSDKLKAIQNIYKES